MAELCCKCMVNPLGSADWCQIGGLWAAGPWSVLCCTRINLRLHVASGLRVGDAVARPEPDVEGDKALAALEQGLRLHLPGLRLRLIGVDQV